ncbi:MAG: hypothetical protein F4223_10655 [Rhodobacteraceae bacterium]|nr:hypothetical protein [Paracoccaceae bacterium]
MEGFRSLHLFPNFNEDVVIVYKIHQNGNHIVFHRIGDHQTVYDPDYENRFRNRRSKKK